ncbi:hypothetical protein SAMN06265365_107179 [Tistlia consotensis]|uniref:Uncharacterized protein n=1 Tax=Tistlia consotensis USBA 355 TaxID=560819 RepID=A0A1Y6BFC9_9PROT|nr:hypothetical protein [Tistlia consotensis]SME98540.1 hypothetical protein SAMN05428998_102181 [Tistlia consotensis USBA 355]SNR57925.1 hypothetical protein SAMN06265365_107179 [Tistlia consotensis]
MKILFVMRNLLYLRNYGSTLRLLAEQGHEIVLTYESERNLLPPEVAEAAETLVREQPRIRLARAVARSGFWAPLAAQVRVLMDFLRYCDPRLETARRCAARAESFVFPPLRPLARLSEARRRRVLPRIQRLAASIEEALPDAAAIRAQIEQERPDCLLVTPLLDFGPTQVEYVKLARRLGIPSALLVASWDNLTNKGLIQICPDRVVVWNHHQAAEAAELHGVPPERIVVTGAQLFDQWFDREPSRDRGTFCRQVGLDPARPFLLYTCSSIFISRYEAQFLERWLTRLRDDPPPALAGIGVLVRPHPGSSKFAAQVAELLERFPEQTALFPREGGYPVTPAAQDDYYDSLHHSAGLIGINTSAMLEAAILGRRCFTILDPEVAESQGGMLHFAHLLRGGFLKTADSFEQHFAQIAEAVEHPGQSEAERAFVADFLRPNGLERPAAPQLARAIEALGALRPAPAAPAPGTALRRLLYAPLALYFLSVEDLRLRKRWAETSLLKLRITQAAMLLARAEKYLLRRPLRSAGNHLRRAGKRSGKWLERRVLRRLRALPARVTGRTAAKQASADSPHEERVGK